MQTSEHFSVDSCASGVTGSVAVSAGNTSLSSSYAMLVAVCELSGCCFTVLCFHCAGCCNLYETPSRGYPGFSATEALQRFSRKHGGEVL